MFRNSFRPLKSLITPRQIVKLDVVRRILPIERRPYAGNNKDKNTKEVKPNDSIHNDPLVSNAIKAYESPNVNLFSISALVELQKMNPLIKEAVQCKAELYSSKFEETSNHEYHGIMMYFPDYKTPKGNFIRAKTWRTLGEKTEYGEARVQAWDMTKVSMPLQDAEPPFPLSLQEEEQEMKLLGFKGKVVQYAEHMEGSGCYDSCHAYTFNIRGWPEDCDVKTMLLDCDFKEVVGSTHDIFRPSNKKNQQEVLEVLLKNENPKKRQRIAELLLKDEKTEKEQKELNYIVIYWSKDGKCSHSGVIWKVDEDGKTLIRSKYSKTLGIYLHEIDHVPGYPPSFVIYRTDLERGRLLKPLGSGVSISMRLDNEARDEAAKYYIDPFTGKTRPRDDTF